MKTLIIIGIIIGIGIILITSLNSLSEIRQQECKEDGGVMTGPLGCVTSNTDYGIDQITSENIDGRLEMTKEFIDDNTFAEATILKTEIDDVSKRIVVTISSEEFSNEFTSEYFEEKLKQWIPFQSRILVAKGFAQLDSIPVQKSEKNSDLEVIITGERQVRRGTTQTIEIQVFRNDFPIEGAKVFIDIEDYGEDLIKEFDGYTNSQGRFIFSWEIPKNFDDIETLLAIVDVTDDISAKTELFKFQIYCFPGENNCKVEGN